jgi:hypothetical protein
MGDRACVGGSSRGCAAGPESQPWSQSAGHAPSLARRRPSPLTSYARDEVVGVIVGIDAVKDVSGVGDRALDPAGRVGDEEQAHQ